MNGFIRCRDGWGGEDTKFCLLAGVHPADRKFLYAEGGYSVPATLHPADRKFSYTGELYDTTGRKSFYSGALYPVGH